METKKFIGVLMVLVLAVALAVPFMSINAEADIDEELVFDLDSVRSDTNEEVEAGSFVDYYFQIENENATEDMEGEVSVAGLISGFSYAIFNNTGVYGDDFDVPAGEVVNVTVRIYAEDGIDGGTTDTFTVTFTESTRDLIAQETLSVTVSNTYSIEHYVWSLATPPAKVYEWDESTPAGDYALYQCWVRNTGNVIVDVGLNLEGEAGLPTGWDVRIFDNLITKTEITSLSNVEPGILNVQTYYVEVETDINDDVGDYGEIVSVAEVIGQPTATITEENLTLNTTVGSSRSAPVWVVAGSSNQDIVAGQEAIFTVDLQNENNVDMNCVISVGTLLGIGGGELTGWSIAIHEDTEGGDALIFDDDDEIVASPASPSTIFTLTASDSNRYFVVITTTTDAIAGTADIDIFATFMSLARDNSELDLTGDIERADDPDADPDADADADEDDLLDFAGISLSIVNWMLFITMLAFVFIVIVIVVAKKLGYMGG